MLHRLQKLTQNAGGYLWTLLPALWDAAQPSPPPPEEPWDLSMVSDGVAVTLNGLYTRHEQPRGLVVIVPGLGASPKSAYCHRAATTLLESGYSSLRLGNVECPTHPPDFHRRDLSHQLTAALSHPPLDRYDQVVLLGYSIGGHSVLRAAAAGTSPRVVALALVSTPFDLAHLQAYFDSPFRRPHRRYFLNMLKDIYQSEFDAGRFPEPPPDLIRARTLRDLDAALAALDPRVPDSVDTFYREASARWVLDRIEQPVLAVLSPTDPMVPSDSVHLSIEGHTDRIDVRWHPGGHVYFPVDTDLGEPGPRGLLPQMITWWERKAAFDTQTQGKMSMKPTL